MTIAAGNPTITVANSVSGPFTALGASLQEFRLAVEGEPGAKLQTMGAATGVLPDVIRSVIAGLAEILAWLHRVVDRVERHVIAGDAAVALFEVGAETLNALSKGLDFGPLADSGGLPEEGLSFVNQAISIGHGALSIAEKLAGSVLPSVDDLLAIRQQLDLLLGQRLAPPLQRNGSLSRLMNRIGL